MGHEMTHGFDDQGRQYVAKEISMIGGQKRMQKNLKPNQKPLHMNTMNSEYRILCT